MTTTLGNTLATPPEPRDPYFLAPYQGERPPAPAWFGTALANAPERTFFPSAGANIELLAWGERGRPGLLFVHGNGAHAHWWSHIAPFFACEWRCAALSFSGMGRSDRRAAGYTIPDLAREVLDAVPAGGIDQGPVPPIIISHSFGGSVALEAAAASPGLFGGVVAVDTPLNLAPAQLQQARSRGQKQRSGHRVFASLAAALAGFRLSPAQECDNHFIADHIARLSLVEVDGGLTWHFDPRRVTIDAKRNFASYRQLSCPSAYIYGERSVLVTRETLPRALDILPAGTPVIAIPDAAHHVMIDQPLALVSALRTLLATWPRAAAVGAGQRHSAA